MSISGFGSIRQTYPNATVGSASGSKFYWQLLDSGLADRDSITISYEMMFEPGFPIW